MAQRVNAAMDGVQPADSDAVIDRAIAEAERRELPSRDDPVLPRCKSGDRRV